MEAEELKKYIHEMVDRIMDERRLRQIYTITHRAFIRDRGVQYERTMQIWAWLLSIMQPFG